MESGTDTAEHRMANRNRPSHHSNRSRPSAPTYTINGPVTVTGPLIFSNSNDEQQSQLPRSSPLPIRQHIIPQLKKKRESTLVENYDSREYSSSSSREVSPVSSQPRSSYRQSPSTASFTTRNRKQHSQDEGYGTGVSKDNSTTGGKGKRSVPTGYQSQSENEVAYFDDTNMARQEDEEGDLGDSDDVSIPKKKTC